MRQAARSRSRGAVKTESISLPAPIGGLNARDSIANMKSTDAIVLDNFFPTTTTVDARRGYTQFATFTGVCESIFVYAGTTTTKVFVAVNTTNDRIMEATAGGALSTVLVGGSGPTVQAITNSRFDYANFGTAGGQFLVAVNGSDVPLQYDGTNWTASGMSGGTPADFFTVAVYAERLWFGVKNSLRVRYQPVNTIAGATVELNLSSLFELGGYLNSIVTVTDASNVLADYICFVSSEGEIVAFSGTDPSSASTWQRVAQFRVGRPVIKGNRCWTKWGADALLICSDGILPLRRAISTNNRDATTTVSDKIRNLINNDVAVHGARYGWALTLHPSGFKLILNVITAENDSARQYVMNVQTGAWCRFTGWDAFCFDVAQDQLYFGGSGFLARADQVGALDDAGASITADAKQAFNYFGGRGRNVLVNLMRPVLAIDGAANIALDIDVDYEDTPPTTFQAIGGSTGDPWGGVWDVTWGGATIVERNWRSVQGFGTAIAPRMRAQVNDVNLSWSVTDFIFERGAAF
jgi:hypothetical protein